MKSIAVASAFILVASTVAVPFTGKRSDTVVRRMERPVEVHIPVPFQRNPENKNHASTEHKAASNNNPAHTVDGTVAVNNRPQRRDNTTTTDEPTASETPEAKNSTMKSDLRRRDNSTSTEDPADPVVRRMERPVEVHVVPFQQRPDHESHAATEHRAASNDRSGHTVDGEVIVNNRPQRRDNATMTEEPTAYETPEAKNSTMSSDMRRRDNSTSTEEPAASEAPEAKNSTMSGDHHHPNDNSTMTEGPAASEDKNSTTSSKLRRRDGPTDTQILQYALTLEHLEKAFYDGALKKFSQHVFVKTGLPKHARQRFEQIAAHEATHVEFLTTALGADAVAACNYNFPYHDPKSFAALSMVLEGVGVSAYLGAAQFIQNKEYLTAAGSILTTESRHAAWVASAVDKVSPWSGPFDTPLDFDQVYSLAAPFITDCPSTNAALPFKAFPTLTVKNKHYKGGDYITLEFDATSASGQPTFLAIFSGLDTIFVPIKNNKAKLPKDLEGTSYGVVTTSNTAVSDQNTVAGVAIFELYSDSYDY